MLKSSRNIEHYSVNNVRPDKSLQRTTGCKPVQKRNFFKMKGKQIFNYILNSFTTGLEEKILSVISEKNSFWEGYIVLGRERKVTEFPYLWLKTTELYQFTLSYVISTDLYFFSVCINSYCFLGDWYTFTGSNCHFLICFLPQ